MPDRETFPPKDVCWWHGERAELMARLADLEGACDTISGRLGDLNTSVAVLAVKMAAFAAVGGVVGSALATLFVRRFLGVGP